MLFSFFVVVREAGDFDPASSRLLGRAPLPGVVATSARTTRLSLMKPWVHLAIGRPVAVADLGGDEVLLVAPSPVEGSCRSQKSILCAIQVEEGNENTHRISPSTSATY